MITKVDLGHWIDISSKPDKFVSTHWYPHDINKSWLLI